MKKKYLSTEEEFYGENPLRKSKPFQEKIFNDDAFEIFRLFYPSRYEILPNGFRIIYKDLNNTEPSLFSSLGTNYTAYYVLINLTIKEMINQGLLGTANDINPFLVEEYKKIIQFLKNNFEFFKSIIPRLGEVLKDMKEIGDAAELASEDVIRKIYGPNVEIERSGGQAKMADTHGGKDRIVTVNGKKINIQIKNVGNINFLNGVYSIECKSAKQYPSVDVIIFKRGNLFYAFRAKDNMGRSTLHVYGDRDGYEISNQYKMLITKLEPTENIQNNT